MGYQIRINNALTKKYEAVNSVAFSKFLAFAQGLKFQKLYYLGKDTCTETYYDTANHLLNHTGIILSRVKENDNIFFKVEGTSSLSEVLNKIGKEVFVHKVGENDNLTDHGFYIKDGITSLFQRTFSIELENVIKNAEPKMEIKINADIYDIVSGTGMRGKLALENKVVINFETNRTYSVQSLTVKLESNPDAYLDEFENLNQLIQKNCKDFILVDEDQFDWANKVTKEVTKEQIKKSKKEFKEKLNSKE